MGTGTSERAAGSRVEVHPVTAARWDDLVKLFGWERGAYGGCWCMWFRVTQREFAENGNPGNRAAMKAIVEDGRVPGLLAYLEGEPVGWVSLAPREGFGRIERSRILQPVDDKPVWSIVCFYIHRKHRREGVGAALLEETVAHARDRGARMLEAYPVDTRGGRIESAGAFVGTMAMFERAGFREVARRSYRRPIMRRGLRPRR
jgi:GNAT superfamily N-acetyltransferase